MEADEVTIREQNFHSQVREYTVGDSPPPAAAPRDARSPFFLTWRCGVPEAALPPTRRPCCPLRPRAALRSSRSFPPSLPAIPRFAPRPSSCAQGGWGGLSRVGRPVRAAVAEG